MGAEVRLSTRELSVVPGDAADLDLVIRNTGGVVDQFALDLVGIPNEWGSYEPPAVRLFPGTDQSVRLRLSPPRLPTTAPGPVHFGMRVSSAEDPAGGAVEEAVLYVAPFSDVQAELVPRALRGRFGGRAQLAVDNRSNIALKASVLGSDPDEMTTVAARPGFVDLAPGSVSFARVRVGLRHRIWRGESVTRPFQVVLQQPESAVQAPVHPPSTAVDAVILQDPVLPRWLWKALLALLALIVLALVLWFNFLKPQIQAAAQNQVARQLASAGITSTPTTVPVPPTSAPGGGGGGGGGGSKGKGSSSGTTVGVTINRTLLVTGNTSATFLVPAGHVLEITDVLVQNTAGTNGIVDFSGSTGPLMLWSMADFRDLDYHWITPITFPPLSKVNLTLAGCSGTCSAGLYFAGSLVKS
jgi:hypothetical protein